MPTGPTARTTHRPAPERRQVQPPRRPSSDSADWPRFGAPNRSICVRFRAYLTPPPPVATYYGYEESCRGLRQTSGEGATIDLRARSTSGPPYLPGPIRHSTATLHSQVAGEGHNNKEF